MTYRVPLYSAGIRGHHGTKREDVNHTRHNPGGRASGSGGSEARKEAEEQARKDAEEKARKDAEEQARKDAEVEAGSTSNSDASSSSTSRHRKRRRHKHKKHKKHSKKAKKEKELSAQEKKALEKQERAKTLEEEKKQNALLTLASNVGELLAVPALNLQTVIGQAAFHELPQSVQQSAIAVARRLDEVTMAAAQLSCGTAGVNMGVANMKEAKALAADAKRKTDIATQMMATIATMRLGR